MNVIPAYGRDYKSKKAVEADWAAGKDFLIQDISSRWDGKPMNKDSVPAGTVVSVRYNKLRNVCFVKA